MITIPLNMLDWAGTDFSRDFLIEQVARARELMVQLWPDIATQTNTQVTAKFIGPMKTLTRKIWDDDSWALLKGIVGHAFHKMGASYSFNNFGHGHNASSWYMYLLAHEDVFTSLNYMNIVLYAFPSVQDDEVNRRFDEFVKDHAKMRSDIDRLNDITRVKRRRPNNSDDESDDGQGPRPGRRSLLGSDYDSSGDESDDGRPPSPEHLPMLISEDDDEESIPIIPVAPVYRDHGMDMKYDPERRAARDTAVRRDAIVVDYDDMPDVDIVFDLPSSDDDDVNHDDDRTVLLPRIGGGTIRVPKANIPFKRFRDAAVGGAWRAEEIRKVKAGIWRDVDASKMSDDNYSDRTQHRLGMSRDLFRAFKKL